MINMGAGPYRTSAAALMVAPLRRTWLARLTRHLRMRARRAVAPPFWYRAEVRRAAGGYNRVKGVILEPRIGLSTTSRASKIRRWGIASMDAFPAIYKLSLLDQVRVWFAPVDVCGCGRTRGPHGCPGERWPRSQ
jgi:hypothetical protein